MTTSIVLVPFGQLFPIIYTQDNFYVFEVEDILIIPVKPRPVMPGIADYQKCETRNDVRRLAYGMVTSDHATEETEEEGDS